MGLCICLERTMCDDLSSHLSKKWHFLCFYVMIHLSLTFHLKIFRNKHFFFPFSFCFSAYHAGLNNKLWTSVLDDWISAKTQVVVATVAFGMVCNFFNNIILHLCLFEYIYFFFLQMD